jgi:hypothetical protein
MRGILPSQFWNEKIHTIPFETTRMNETHLDAENGGVSPRETIRLKVMRRWIALITAAIGGFGVNIALQKGLLDWVPNAVVYCLRIGCAPSDMVISGPNARQR